MFSQTQKEFRNVRRVRCECRMHEQHLAWLQCSSALWCLPLPTARLLPAPLCAVPSCLEWICFLRAGRVEGWRVCSVCWLLIVSVLSLRCAVRVALSSDNKNENGGCCYYKFELEPLEAKIHNRISRIQYKSQHFPFILLILLSSFVCVCLSISYKKKTLSDNDISLHSNQIPNDIKTARNERLWFLGFTITWR